MMRGQLQLESLRRRRHAPGAVFIDLGRDLLGMADDWLDIKPETAYLNPGPHEKPSVAALRCVVGLMVFVHGDDAAQVHAWRDACIAAKAKRVIAAVTVCTDSAPKYERYSTTAVHDTTGVLTWQA